MNNKKTTHTTVQHNPTRLCMALFLTLLLLLSGMTKTWAQTPITSLSAIADDPAGSYVITDDINASGFSSSIATFTGTLTAQAKADGTFPVISNLSVPLFTTATGATISNLMLKSVGISQAGYVGAICCTANGTTRIYNCGILPTDKDNTSSSRSTVASTNNHCGSLVGYLDGYARVINCFSYANVTGGTVEGGLVGYNTTATMQGNSQTNFNNNVKTMVVNCMFYGDITGEGTKYPVYGGQKLVNNAQDKVNNYNYFYEEATFDDSYTSIDNYNCSWPVAEKYLTRYEVYRNILNSNRRLCTWWVCGTYQQNKATTTDAEVKTVGIAKWVLDPAIAPYPILKKWGKYYSTFYRDPDNVYHELTKTTESRAAAKEWEGKSYTTLSVTIKGGDNNSSASASRNIMITDMDTLGYDYCAKKIQLPYYNEIFGNPDGETWEAKYGNNYTSKVVTGWKITAVTDDDDFSGTRNSFDDDWESGYNFADRNCTEKDLYDTSGRVFAQGGYYYVPDHVKAITIEAYWGDAVYLCNNNRVLDRVNNGGSDFYDSGQLPSTINGIAVKTSLTNAVAGLSVKSEGSVYDQAIVLVGNYQQNNIHNSIHLDGSKYATDAKPFTIMSADFDFDNEPDFCFQAGMSGGGRENIQPIRLDFLVVPDITMAVRTAANYYGMRIFCPQGHFEITETSYLYTTQFEYDKRTDNAKYNKHEAPMILNGGEFMQIVSTQSANETTAGDTANKRVDCTSYFLMGGNVYMKAFTPGTHTSKRCATRHCAVNAIGGEYPELYLSGMFNANFYNMTDNPHAYLDGGKFGTVAGAGMESVGGEGETNGGDVTFKINHSWIKEFYGGGINATRPVTGNIWTTCNNSVIHKYCGGPKFGNMGSSKTITNDVTNTVFDQYFGGGNGGTNMLRENKYDKTDKIPTNDTKVSYWGSYGFTAFTPLKYEANKGYQAEFEFELLPMPKGDNATVMRSYYHYASFAKTTVAPITNTITDCTFTGNYYGGGNLGAVGGNVQTTLKGHTVVHGSAFGAGYSASIPVFQVHDKSTVVYAYSDYAGFMHDGSVDYDSKKYTWIHDIPADWGVTASTSKPTFQHDGTWYCYTTEDLTGLGAVSGNASLTIEGTTEIDGNVYGGGDQSAVNGNATVNILGNTEVTGNVFGGGNKGEVSGNTKVNVMYDE